jgi:hypothetical protein
VKHEQLFLTILKSLWFPTFCSAECAWSTFDQEFEWQFVLYRNQVATSNETGWPHLPVSYQHHWRRKRTQHHHLWFVLAHPYLVDWFLTAPSHFDLISCKIGSATERLVETSSVCQPGLELKVHVKTVNLAENGELLESPWSVDGVYQCKSEGISDARLHITIEVVHVHRFEMVPPPSFPLTTGVWPSPTQGLSHSYQDVAPYNQIPQSWNPYYPWYPPPPQAGPVRAAIRARPRPPSTVTASFGRKKNSRINHPWWWFLTLSLSYPIPSYPCALFAESYL